jgi:hypothetical protein
MATAPLSCLFIIMAAFASDARLAPYSFLHATRLVFRAQLAQDTWLIPR